MKIQLTTGNFKWMVLAMLLLVAGTMIILFIGLSTRAKSEARWVTHTQEVVLHSEKLFTHNAEAETGIMEYVLSGNRSYIDSVDKSKKEISTEHKWLKQLTNTNEAQKAYMDSLSFYIERRSAFLNSLVVERTTNGIDAAMAAVKTGQGKIYTDRMRFFIDKIQVADKLLSDKLKSDEDRKAERMNKTMLLLSAVFIVALFALLFFRSRLKSQKELTKSFEKIALSKTDELSNVFDRISDAFVALDKNWCYTYMNKKAGEIFQRNPTAIIGKHIWTEFPEGVGQPFYNAYYQAMEQQQYIHLQEYYPPYNKWFENHIYPSPEGLSIFFRDITVRKLSEETLERREQRFRALVENNDGIISLVDEQLNVLFLSASAARITGWENEEFENKHAEEYIHPDDLPVIQAMVSRAIQQPGENYSITLRVRHKNGSYIWLEGMMKNMLHDKAIGGIVINLRDVTARKKAEKALQESEAKFRSVVENIHEALIIEDREGNLVYANSEFYHMFGYSSGEQHILTLKDYTAPSSYDEVLERHNNRMKGMKVSEEFEYKGKRKDGTEIWIEARVSSVIENGQVAFTQSLERDITERKLAQQHLKLSENRTRKIFESGMIGFIFWDADGEILEANNYFLKMTGYTQEDLRNRKIHWKEMTPPEYAALDRKGLEEITQTGISQPFEKEYFRKDGSRVPVLVGATSLDEDSPLKGVAYVIDITERLRAEKKLKEQETYLRAILDAEPECVKVLNYKGELVSMNPAGLAMIEADSEEQVLGRRMSELVLEKYRNSFKKLSKAVFDGIEGTLEFEIIGLKGSHRWLKTHAVALKDAAGKITSLLGVTTDITKQKQAEAEISNSTAQLRQLTAHLQSIREEERKRIGREIHDELGQQLTAIKMDAVWIDKKIANLTDTTTEKIPIKNKLQNLITLVDGSNESVRKILHELRHGILEDNGLVEALEWQSNQFTEITGVPVKFISRETSVVLPEQIANCLFRLYQESLTNIARHANASKVYTHLQMKKTEILLHVEDDGKGFDPLDLQNRQTFGILGMKERVFSLNGKFKMISEIGKGTTIQVALPIV